MGGGGGGAAGNWGQSETCLLSVMEASRSNTFHRRDLTVSQSVTPPSSLLLLPFNPPPPPIPHSPTPTLVLFRHLSVWRSEGSGTNEFPPLMRGGAGRGEARLQPSRASRLREHSSMGAEEVRQLLAGGFRVSHVKRQHKARTETSRQIGPNNCNCTTASAVGRCW